MMFSNGYIEIEGRAGDWKGIVRGLHSQQARGDESLHFLEDFKSGNVSFIYKLQREEWSLFENLLFYRSKNCSSYVTSDLKLSCHTSIFLLRAEFHSSGIFILSGLSSSSRIAVGSDVGGGLDF